MRTMVECPPSPHVLVKFRILSFDLRCLISVSPLLKNPLDFMIYEASAFWIFDWLLHVIHACQKFLAATSNCLSEGRVYTSLGGAMERMVGLVVLFLYWLVVFPLVCSALIPPPTFATSAEHSPAGLLAWHGMAH